MALKILGICDPLIPKAALACTGKGIPNLVPADELNTIKIPMMNVPKMAMMKEDRMSSPAKIIDVPNMKVGIAVDIFTQSEKKEKKPQVRAPSETGRRAIFAYGPVFISAVGRRTFFFLIFITLHLR
jgi:hypothetical protein